jgi:Flp pilus assembly protein TadD
VAGHAALRIGFFIRSSTMSRILQTARLLSAGLLSMWLTAHADMSESTPTAPTAPDVSAELKKARGLIEQQKYAEAIRELKVAEQKDPMNPNVQNWLGYSNRKLGYLDVSFQYYNTALKLDPRHRGAHEYIGEAYLMARKPEKAQEHLAALKSLCGTECAEYRELDKAIAAYKP